MEENIPKSIKQRFYSIVVDYENKKKRYFYGTLDKQNTKISDIYYQFLLAKKNRKNVILPIQITLTLNSIKNMIKLNIFTITLSILIAIFLWVINEKNISLIFSILAIALIPIGIILKKSNSRTIDIDHNGICINTYRKSKFIDKNKIVASSLSMGGDMQPYMRFFINEGTTQQLIKPIIGIPQETLNFSIFSLYQEILKIWQKKSAMFWDKEFNVEELLRL